MVDFKVGDKVIHLWNGELILGHIISFGKTTATLGALNASYQPTSIVLEDRAKIKDLRHLDRGYNFAHATTWQNYESRIDEMRKYQQVIISKIRESEA